MMKITCETVQPELKAYLDKMLSPIAAFRVRQHILKCDGCRTELAEVERIGKELHSMATDMSAEGDSLDPILRARILAAIPTEASMETPRNRQAFRFRPVMAVGALAAAIIAAVVILPQHPFYPQVLHEASNSMAKRAMRDEANSTSSNSAAKAIGTVTAAAPSEGVQPKVAPASSQPGGIRSRGPAQSVGGAGGAAAMPAAPAYTSGSAADQVDNNYAKMPASGAAGLPAADSGFTPGGKALAANGAVIRSRSSSFAQQIAKASDTARNALKDAEYRSARAKAGESYTFVTNNLTEGEKLVRLTVASFHGVVTGLPPAAGAYQVVLTISVPAPSSAAMLAAIIRESRGALHEQARLSKDTTFGDGHASGGFGAHALGSVNGSTMGGSIAQSPNRITVSKDQAKAASGPSGSMGNKSKAEGKLDGVLTLAGPNIPAPETITIVLVKGR